MNYAEIHFQHHVETNHSQEHSHIVQNENQNFEHNPQSLSTLEKKLLDDKKKIHQIKKVHQTKIVIGLVLSHLLIFLIGSELFPSRPEKPTPKVFNEINNHKILSQKIKYFSHFQEGEPLTLVDLYNEKKEIVLKNVKLLNPKSISKNWSLDKNDSDGDDDLKEDSNNEDNDFSNIQIRTKIYNLALNPEQTFYLTPYLEKVLLAFPAGTKLMEFKNPKTNIHLTPQKNSKNNSTKQNSYSRLQQPWSYQ